MDTNDESVKKALDDLFGDSVEEKTITIDDFDKTMAATNSITIAEIDKALGNEPEVNKETPKSEIEEPEVNETNNDNINIDNIPNFDDTTPTSLDSNSNEVEINLDEIDEIKDIDEEEKNITPDEENNDADIDKEVEKIIKDNIEEPINYKKVILFIIFGFVIGFFVVFLLVNHMNNQEKSVNCSYEIEDTGYENTNEYKITYAGNKIRKIYGLYKYKAKTDEFEKQIEYIKDEKMPVILNSNGMPGFTYYYTVGTDFIEVESYLEFDKMDFKVINKINWDAQPISYFKFNSKTKYRDLKTYFEKNAYKCVATD